MAKDTGRRKPVDPESLKKMLDEMAAWQRRADAEFAKKMGPPTSEALDATLNYPSEPEEE